MKTPIVVIALACVAVVAVLAGTVLSSFSAKKLEHILRPDDSKLIATGRRIYMDRFASCHGSRLEGQPEWRTRNADGLLPAPPHDADGHT